jgi:hypothetical protein
VKDHDGNYIGFKIMLSEKVSKDVKVSWWIVEAEGEEKAVPQAAISTPNETPTVVAPATVVPAPTENVIPNETTALDTTTAPDTNSTQTVTTTTPDTTTTNTSTP